MDIDISPSLSLSLFYFSSLRIFSRLYDAQEEKEEELHYICQMD